MNETAVDTLVALGFPLAVLTGLDGVDDVLQNDLQYGDVSEISGNNGAGKTQLCYALVTNMLLSTEFGIVWIDSSGSFRSFRLMEYIHGRKEATNKDIMVLLDRLRVIRATDHVQLIEALKYAEEHMDEDNIRFIIIDNVREMFDDRLIGENSGRSAITNVVLGQINVLTDIGFTVVTTTCCSQNEEKNEPTKLWKQQMRGRVFIEEGDGDVRTIQFLDASNVSSRCNRFRITHSGLQDVN